MDRDAIIHLLQQRLPGLLAIYIFGSRAQGTAGAASDLDLAVLAPTKIDPIVLWEVTAALMPLADSEVDLVDLRRATTVMQHQVVTTGTLWWVSDALAVNLWELQVLREKMELDEARAPLLADIARTGVVYGR